ncbi:hypothetical protein ONZ43_g4829 [Nemania bipapillata]|uniref:Uncharacterized protein n=1 Tax=Nemania bipapillata TaxID=110536 RepID=A0ACC2II44_9PEZI|nr:hypothetical protein ONZ43_g4829 [Nemania bipapillata]
MYTNMRPLKMPLVQKLWGPYGLKAWKVTQYTSANAPWSVQAWLEWESQEHAEKGQASDGTVAIFDDVAKFSDNKAVLMEGDMTGSASF